MAALGMLSGTLAAVRLSANAACWLAGGLLALCAAAALLNRRACMICLAFASLALALTALRLPEAPAGGRHSIAGRVAETPEVTARGCSVILDEVRIDGGKHASRLRIYLYGGQAPAYGDQLEAEAVLRAPDTRYALSDAYRGISATGSAGSYRVTGRTRDLYGALLGLRTRAAEQIGRLFPESGGVAAAMLLGDKSGVTEASLEAYRASGTAHLMAVSGLHVSVLAGAWMLLFRRRPRLRFILTAAFLLCYAALTAFSPSVLRASVMLLCWQLAAVLRVPNDRFSALCLAFVVVLLANPCALFYAGFQLSFLAAYGLALLAPVLEDRLARLGPGLSRAMAGSAAVWLAALPVQIAFFGGAPLVSLLLNLFVLPLAPYFLVPAFLLTLASFVCFPLADALAFLPRLALNAIDFFSRIDGGLFLRLPAPPAASILLYTAALLFASRLCMRPRGRRALCSAVCLFAGAAVWALWGAWP